MTVIWYQKFEMITVLKRETVYACDMYKVRVLTALTCRRQSDRNSW